MMMVSGSPKIRKKRSPAVIKLSMEQAAATLYQLGVETFSQFERLCEDGKRPDTIPRHIDSFYKDYPGWQAFISLGKNYAAKFPVQTAASYEQLKAEVHHLQLKSKGAYLQAYRQKLLPPGSPFDPASYFPEFEGWVTFLLKAPYISYAEAKIIIKPYRLKSSYQWRNFCRNGLKPEGIPVLPDRDYDEFVSWADFLGFEEN